MKLSPIISTVRYESNLFTEGTEHEFAVSAYNHDPQNSLLTLPNDLHVKMKSFAFVEQQRNLGAVMCFSCLKISPPDKKDPGVYLSFILPQKLLTANQSVLLLLYCHSFSEPEFRSGVIRNAFKKQKWNRGIPGISPFVNATLTFPLSPFSDSE
jgi:hypothetical protein